MIRILSAAYEDPQLLALIRIDDPLKDTLLQRRQLLNTLVSKGRDLAEMYYRHDLTVFDSVIFQDANGKCLLAEDVQDVLSDLGGYHVLSEEAFAELDKAVVASYLEDEDADKRVKSVHDLALQTEGDRLVVTQFGFYWQAGVLDLDVMAETSMLSYDLLE